MPHYRSPVGSNQQVAMQENAASLYTPQSNVTPIHQMQLHRQHPHMRPAQGNLFAQKLGKVDRKVNPPQTQQANPMQIIAQLQNNSKNK